MKNEVKQALYEIILKLWPLVYGGKKDNETETAEGPGSNPPPPPPPPPGIG